MKQVYFIKPVGMDGPVKIGTSWWPEGRMRERGYWVPFPLELIATIPGDQILEGRFHRLFLESRSHGEWFVMTDHMRSVISQIQAGTFDCDSLPEYLGPIRFAEKQERAA